ncbi:MAG: hypothetical protein AAB798_00470 [Patescibacteria group bacterium]
MEEKKTPQTWYLGITHVLTASFIFPFIIGFAFVYLFVPILAPVVGELAFSVLNSIVSVAALWIGVIYSSKFIHSRYNIRDSRQLVRLSTIIVGVLTFGSVLLSIVISANATITQVQYDMISGLFDATTAVVLVGVFYYTSKRMFLQ